MNLYFISGLGADKHAFDRIKLKEGTTVHFLEWMEPELNESIQHYAQRMAQDIDTSKPFCLVGLSFGGIMSIEIAKLIKPEKIFIVSSICKHDQLPKVLRLGGKLNLHKIGLIPTLKNSTTMLYWLFGVHTPKMKEYLKSMIDKTTTSYLQWSMDVILKWQQHEKLSNLIHIHGDSDKLFPIQGLKPDYTISRGSHFMILTHASRISDILNKELDAITIHT